MDWSIQDLAAGRLLACPDFRERGGPPHGFVFPPVAASAGPSPEAVLEALGHPEARPLAARQVHGDEVVELTEPTREPPEADALLARLPGLAPLVRTADCVPVLLWSPDTGAVGAVHAGWRGLAAGIIPRAVEQLAPAAPHGLQALVGPSAGPCCYEVGPEVAERFPKECLVPGRRQRLHLDLWRTTVLHLDGAGLAKARIHASGRCTVCDPLELPSWRREPGTSKRILALILCPEAR